MRAPGVALMFCLALFTEVHSQKPYKLCAKSKSEDCSKLGRSDEVTCVDNYHNTDCILNIEKGKTDFGRVTAEQALVAAKFVSNVVVVGEFRSDAIYDDSAYATVVLVRSDHTNGLRGLRGKKYCHPGFKFDEVVTELVLKEFENVVLKNNGAEGCSSTVDSGTLLEKELKALSEFFGPSCRPGPWVGLEDFDNKFYQRYPSLCELCTSNNKCTVQPGAAPFMQSLDCLVNGGGDLTLTTINTVKEFFNRTENINKKEDYRYLCRDGKLAKLDDACTWSKQPWDLIIANRNQAPNIKTELESWVPKNIIASGSTAFSAESELFEESLKNILFPTEKQYNKIKFISNEPSLNDYIKNYRDIPNVRDNGKCNQNLKWCTVSNEEQQKCEWLAQASLNYAIQPVISCIQSENNLTCLEDIKNDKADVVASDAHFGYIARRKNLAPLAYPATDIHNLIKPIVVIKESNGLNIQRFENLKTRKACFPEYGGIEWLSFINTARDHKVLSKTTCDYGELINEFVGDSCMPGARDSEHEKSNKANEEKLCSLCVPDPYYAKTATTCNTDNTNKYYGNVGALTCLKEIGDFAVITKGVYSAINASEFRVLCRNGSLASNPGFDVDENCILTSIIDSEVVSKRNSPKNSDLGIVLLNFERRFGTDRVKAFEIFNVFNDTLNLLFKDSTLGLTNINSDTARIKNYVELFAHTAKCTEENDNGLASSLSKITMLTLIPTFILLLLAKF